MVDFSLTEEQKMMKEQARKFAINELRPAEVAIDKIPDPVEAFNSEHYHGIKKKMYQMGYHKVRIPEKFGGLGQSNVTQQIILEELAVGGVALAHSVPPWGGIALLMAQYGEQLGSQEIIDQWVLPFTNDEEGKISGCLAATEPDLGSDLLTGLGRSQTTARKDGDSFVINGSKAQWISNGSFATDILVTAQTDPSKGHDALAVFMLKGDTPGVSRGKPADKIGERAKNQCELFFDDVRVPASAMVLPSFSDDFQTNFLSMGNTNIGTFAVGLMRAAFEDAVEYAKARIQGGKPIIEHQVIAMKLMDAYTIIEAGRALKWKSARLIDERIEQRKPVTGDLKLAVSARAFSCDECLRVVSEMAQIYGGYGLTKEYPVEKYLRDAKAMTIADGTTEILSLKAAEKL